MLVLGASLLWGGCAPCQQIFLSASQQGGCCLPSGQCKTASPQLPAHKNCTGPALALQQYAPAAAAEVAFAQPAGLAAEQPKWVFSPSFEPASPDSLVLPFDSPPDLYRRHSALLI
jgi:hypothetical protein